MTEFAQSTAASSTKMRPSTMHCSISRFAEAFTISESNETRQWLVKYRTGSMVTMISNDEHKRRRRMLSHPYSNSYILNSQTLDSILSRVSRRLREGITGCASTGTSVDVYQHAKCCMLDVASGYLFDATDTLRDPGFGNDLTTLAKATSKNLHVRTSLDWPMTYFASLIGGNVLPDPDARGRWQA